MPTKRTETYYSDPYTLLDSPRVPGYAARLRELGALDNLTTDDARQVAGIIIRAVLETVAPRDARLALCQRAANVGAGCDVRQWHDRTAASKALGAAADALNDADGK